MALHNDCMLPKRVLIREVGVREGVQSSRLLLPTEVKRDLVLELAQSGVQSIEVTSFVRGDRVPQMADADTLVSSLGAPPAGVEYTGLYLNARGFERAVAHANLTNRGWVYLATSNQFLHHNTNSSIDLELAAIPEWKERFATAGIPFFGVMISMAFGCGYAGKGAALQLKPILEKTKAALDAHEIDVNEVSLADTVGMGTPDDVRRGVSAVREVFPKAAPSLHLHDTRGLALVNAHAGLHEGVEVFESSLGGVGGCPFTPGAAGNIVTEDLAHFCAELGVETGIDLARYCHVVRRLEGVLGTKLPGKMSRVLA
jgi:hydroxymethylglutaryl-CoA lyase